MLWEHASRPAPAPRCSLLTCVFCFLPPRAFRSWGSVASGVVAALAKEVAEKAAEKARTDSLPVSSDDYNSEQDDTEFWVIESLYRYYLVKSMGRNDQYAERSAGRS